MPRAIRTIRFRPGLRRCEGRLAPAAFIVSTIADSGPGTLRQALDDANALPGPDSVTFSPTIFAEPQTISLTTGQLSVTDDVTIQGPGAGLTTVANAAPAGPASRVLHVDRPGRVLAVSISGLTFFGGRLTGVAGFGAGILTSDESVTLTDVAVTGNEAAARGGGIAQTGPGSLILQGCSVTANRSASGSGGGIANTSTGRVTLIACTVSTNEAAAQGGGIYFFNGGGLDVERSTISGNKSVGGRGGGVYFFGAPDGPLTVSNSTFSGNTAKSEGGALALRNFAGGLDVQFATVTANVAAAGGGIAQSGSGFASVALDNTIVSGNAAAIGADIAAIQPISLSFSAIGVAAGFSPRDDGNNLPFGADLKLGMLADNGGPSKTHALHMGSAALDEGDSPASILQDQRGLPRTTGLAADIGAYESASSAGPVATLQSQSDWNLPGPLDLTFSVTYAATSSMDGSTIGNDDIRVTGPDGFDAAARFVAAEPNGDAPMLTAVYVVPPPGGAWTARNSGDYFVHLQSNSLTDIGGIAVPAATMGRLAVRVPGEFIVNSPFDADHVDGKLNLREAVALANESPSGADTIRFDSVTFGSGMPIELVLGELRITSGMSIEGLPAGLTIDAGGQSRIFAIDDGDPTRSTPVTLVNLTLIGGTRSGQSAADRGGAVDIRDEAVTLVNCTLTGNSAAFGAGAVNLAAAPGRLVLDRCIISDNFTNGDGGAIRAGDGTSLVVRRTTLERNRASGNGGAAFTNGAAVTIESSTFSSNRADGPIGGGALALFGDSAATILNSTLSGNWADRDGGGVVVIGSEDLVVRHSTIVGNEANSGVGGGISRPSGSAALTIVSSIVAGNFNTSAPDVFSRGLVELSYSAVESGEGFAPAGSHNLPFGVNLVLGPLAANGGPTKTHRPLRGSPLVNAGGNASGLPTDQRGRDYPRTRGSRIDIGAVEAATPMPTATADADIVLAPGGTAFTFAVTYEHFSGIQATTLGTGDVIVTGPNGFTAMPALLSVDSNGDGSPRTATYSFTSPGGEWDATDVGDYRIDVRPGEVLATDGLAVPPRPAGTFSVRLPRMLQVTNTNDGGPGSLRQAIMDANATRTDAADTITFDPNVFATFQRIVVESELVITDALTIVGPGPALLSVSGGFSTRILDLDGASTAPVIIRGVRFENGRAFVGDGGGIRNRNLALSLDDCWVINCLSDAGSGGGIALTDGDASLVVTDSRLTGNAARGFGLTGNGGAIGSNGPSRVTLLRSTIAGNVADDNGGGVAAIAGGHLTIIDSTLSSNRADAGQGGAAMVTTAGTVVVRNSTVSGNSAATLGAGFALGGAVDAVISNITLTGNEVTMMAGHGGGIAVVGGDVLLDMASTAVAGNTAVAGPDVSAPLTRPIIAANCFIGQADSTDADIRGMANQLGTVAAPLDPMLLPLADNGGSTNTHSLAPASPLRDAGANPAALANDQRGPGFLRMIGNASDIGSFEASVPPLPPTATVIVNNGSAQRSRVNVIQIVFSPNTTFPAGVNAALTVTRTGPAEPAGTVPTVAVLGGTSLTVLFSPSVMAPFAGSLIDGNYRLTIVAAHVASAGGNLDGNGDGLGGDDLVVNFHRLFGDGDGDRDVDAGDFSAFRGAFSGPTSTFDGDFDGDTDAADFAGFRARFGSALP